MPQANQPTAIPIALTIAGSDSCGGAGIQADLRTFLFHQVYGASAITCVTAQNTCGVTRVDALPAAAVVAQIEAVTSDLDVRATKTGMLLNREIIAAVSAHLESAGLANLVVDPVMVSRAGDKLIDDEAIELLRRELLPQAKILTPNVYEARLLAEMEIKTAEDMKAAARKIQSLGPAIVIVKGGGLSGDLRGVDVWFDGKQMEVLATEFVDTPNNHGTGCTFSSAIAANLAKGIEPLVAARAAKEYVTNALKHSLSIGKGKGPVGHFYPLLRS